MVSQVPLVPEVLEGRSLLIHSLVTPLKWQTFWTYILVGDVYAGTSRRIKGSFCWRTGSDQQIDVSNSKFSATSLNGFFYLWNKSSLLFSLKKKQLK